MSKTVALKKKKSTPRNGKAIVTGGHDTVSCPDLPKFNLEVLKNTISLDEAEELNDAQLHENVGMTLARGVGAYRSFCNLMTVVKERLNDGKAVGNCKTLRLYVETYVQLPDESFDAAIRKVYRAIDESAKDPRRTGRPKLPKAKDTPVPSGTVHVDDLPAEVRAKIEARIKAQEAEDARIAESKTKQEVEKAKQEAVKNERESQAILAAKKKTSVVHGDTTTAIIDNIAKAVAVGVMRSGAADEKYRKELKAARVLALKYLKLRNIPLSALNEVAQTHSAAVQP